MCPLQWTQFFNFGSAILTSLWTWNYAQAIPGFALAHYKNNSEQLHTQLVYLFSHLQGIQLLVILYRVIFQWKSMT